MPFTYDNLTDVTRIASGTTPHVLFLNGSGTRAHIAEIEMHNTSGGSINVAYYVVPNSGGSPGTPSLTNRLVNIGLPGSDTVFSEPKFPYILSREGDSIQFLVSGDGVNVQLRGGFDDAV